MKNIFSDPSFMRLQETLNGIQEKMDFANIGQISAIEKIMEPIRKMNILSNPLPTALQILMRDQAYSFNHIQKIAEASTLLSGLNEKIESFKYYPLAPVFNAATESVLKYYTQNPMYIPQQESENTDAMIEEVAEVIREDKYLTKSEFKEVIEGVFNKFTLSTEKWNSKDYASFIVAVLALLVAIYVAFRDSPNTPPSNPPSNDQIQNSLVQSYINRLPVFQKQRKAIINSPLRFSFRKKSQIICAIKKGESVAVLLYNHKRLLVSFYSNELAFPITGWVLKKHFTSTKWIKDI